MEKQHLIGIVGASVLAMSPIATASEWSIGAAFNQKTGYDNNFLMKDVSPSTWSYQFKPSVEVAYRTPIAESALTLDVSINRYDNFGEYNGEDIRLDWLNSYEGERFTLGLNLGYSDTATRDVARSDTGDFASNDTVETVTAEPSLVWTLSERDELDVSYIYSDRTYTGQNFNANESETVSLAWSRSISEKLSTLVSVSQTRYEAELGLQSSVETDFNKYNVGLSYLLTKALTVDASVGFFTSKIGAVGDLNNAEMSDSDSDGGLVDISFTLKGQRHNATLGLSANLTPTSLGEVNETHSLNLGWDYSLSEKSKLGASAHWIDTQSIETPDRENTSITIFYQYKIYKNFDVKVEWSNRGQDRDSLDEPVPLDQNVKSSQMSISFNYSI